MMASLESEKGVLTCLPRRRRLEPRFVLEALRIDRRSIPCMESARAPSVVADGATVRTLHRPGGATNTTTSTARSASRLPGVRRRGAPVVIAAAVGGLVALASAYLVWPHGTVNLDEIAYLNQAEAITHGSLTYDAGTYLPDFRPYLSGVADDRIVFKYQPLWPAVLAGSEAATGDHRPGLVLAGAATALAMGLLGRELTGSRWLGTATATAVAVSPIFVSHSGSVLAYLPSGGLVAASIGAGLRVGRTGSRAWSLAAGAGFGALFFHRPYDAVLAAIPVGVWLAWRARRDARWASLVTLVLAAAPFVAAWLAYNRYVTGDVLQPAFSVDAPEDRFGFGPRASWAPTDPEVSRDLLDFTPWGSLRTVGRFGVVTPLWLAGGVVTLALAVLAVARRRDDGRRWVLAATAGTVIAGHALWWGTQNFVNFGLTGPLGPAYWLGALGPVMALAVAGGRELVSYARGLAPPRRKALLAGTAVVGLVGSVVGAAVVGSSIGRAERERDRQIAVVEAAPRNSVLVLPGGIDDPFVRVVVPADLDAEPRLVAVDERTSDQLFRLRDRFDDRSLWTWLPIHRPGSAFEEPDRYQLGNRPEVAAPQVDVRLTLVDGAVPSGTAWLRTLDDDGAEIDRVEIAFSGSAAQGAAVPAAGASADVEGSLPDAGPGGAPAARTLAIGRGPTWLAAGATVVHGDGPRDVVEVRWAARSRDGRVEVIGPGAGHRFYDFPDGGAAWFPEDVAGSLTADVAGLEHFEPVQELSELP
jgi:hypothetical protein